MYSAVERRVWTYDVAPAIDTQKNTADITTVALAMTVGTENPVVLDAGLAGAERTLGGDADRISLKSTTSCVSATNRVWHLPHRTDFPADAAGISYSNLQLGHWHFIVRPNVF